MIKIIPRGRSKVDKYAYIYLQWFARKNQHEIMAKVRDKMIDELINGKGVDRG